jgi:hypothetical protein
MKRRPILRTEYRITPPPRDGSVIVVPRRVEVEVYWDDVARRWALVQPLHIDSIGNDTVLQWKRPR